jgi:hypothetical protein
VTLEPDFLRGAVNSALLGSLAKGRGRFLRVAAAISTSDSAMTVIWLNFDRGSSCPFGKHA